MRKLINLRRGKILDYRLSIGGRKKNVSQLRDKKRLSIERRFRLSLTVQVFVGGRLIPLKKKPGAQAIRIG